MEVTYSYWDGSGHRKVIQIKKGATIGKFLEAVKLQLMDEFKELRSVSSEDILYVKEDLIIPQVCSDGMKGLYMYSYIHRYIYIDIYVC
ncbi:hypothetical protein EON65_43115 [archaeon]|nr:MAG: hypothetical protein EON65_43115 [archaeon]